MVVCRQNGESLRRLTLFNIGWSFGLSMYGINIMETSKRRRSVRLLTIHRVQPQLDPFLPFHYRNSASRECLFSIFRSHRHSSRPPQFHCHDGRLLWPDCTLSFIALHDANPLAGDPVDSDPLWFHCSAALRARMPRWVSPYHESITGASRRAFMHVIVPPTTRENRRSDPAAPAGTSETLTVFTSLACSVCIATRLQITLHT